ncbi:hypothetical protein IHE45_04G126700 [Dioscorea alata]|uniref:Uncharacterized protein n=1 Tax=Dioscorea alata TaxID=55571 RepID=A0ACB7WG50_DIOAL|nr:hypothetical protein IHE45_04G126700 [Dioscorea alata]
MKKASVLAVAAAASAAVTSGSAMPSDEGTMRKEVGEGSGSPRKGADKGKFAPRFDGLRFIETLVTAHR